MMQPSFSRKTFFGLGLGAAIGAVARPGLAHAQQATPMAGIGTPMPPQPFVNGVEALVYNNPFGQEPEPFWYEGNHGFHLDLGLATEKPAFPIAEQYVFVYEDEFQAPTAAAGFKQQPKVDGQFPIFDSVPGDPNYSPIWHNNWVLVPRGFEPNSIRSVDAIKSAGLRVESSNYWVN
ncbi:MAG TPA: hypothetical protein VFU81_03125 [Thermomicrobiales bacterium]|nr:hypothetical protein [Thermomicrobiales bacterium]